MKLLTSLFCGNRQAMWIKKDLPKVLLASTNQGKIQQLRRLFSGIIDLIPIRDMFQDFPEVDEPHGWFLPNAMRKAAKAVAFTNMPVIAEDSGLCIYALHGKPGVYSARYADDDTDLESTDRDARCIEKVLREMKDIPDKARGACYQCHLVLMMPDGRTAVSEGHWRGYISHTARGNLGFGYDPIFIDGADVRQLDGVWPSLEDRFTAGEYDKTDRNHRTIAARDLRQGIDIFINGYAAATPKNRQYISTQTLVQRKDRGFDVDDEIHCQVTRLSESILDSYAQSDGFRLFRQEQPSFPVGNVTLDLLKSRPRDTLHGTFSITDGNLRVDFGEGEFPPTAPVDNDKLGL